jgi:hypothetical protein
MRFIDVFTAEGMGKLGSVSTRTHANPPPKNEIFGIILGSSLKSSILAVSIHDVRRQKR